MLQNRTYTFWFLTGSQQLYGDEILERVENQSKKMVERFNQDKKILFRVEFKQVLTNSEDIYRNILKANQDENCAGIITWMHTFSPAKMWIFGLNSLQKPLLHLHTQYNQNIPWQSIDMNYMNLNQSAHGDREFGFMGTRLNIARKVITGHWENGEVITRMNNWMKTAIAVTEGPNIRVARFGDNMRNVAVTDGDKIEAQIKFGWTVDYYGIGDLVEVIDQVTDEAVEHLFAEYNELYELPVEATHPGDIRDSIKEQARIEIGIRTFLEEKGYTAFTTNFEDLHGMKQLPGLAAQRLMAEGYGFAGEGDWRTAALLRMMKIIGDNEQTSFMEDYTYHLEPGNEMILGSHMLEICPTIAKEKPKIVVHPLTMGNKQDPARLVFDSKQGEARVASLVELGGRYRLIINEVEAVEAEQKTPKLHVRS